MKAQKLYNFREQTAFCSGNDLQGFFSQQVGDPSPSGEVDINVSEADNFVLTSIAAMVINGLDWMEGYRLVRL